MKQLNRRSMLRRSVLAVAAGLHSAGSAGARVRRPEPDRKLRVVAVGGHYDDAQGCAGGTLALFADQGHDVVGLSMVGGPPPPPGADPKDPQVRGRLDAMKAAEILKIRLECLNYEGSNSAQFGPPIVYRSAAEVTGQRYKEFTEILLDKYNPDIVLTHWPIDFHMDHRATSLLVYSAWLAAGKRFPLYYMEAEMGVQTQNFFPTHFVDTSSVAERTHEAAKAVSKWYSLIWPTKEAMRKARGMQAGCQVAEAFNLQPGSPNWPGLP